MHMPHWMFIWSWRGYRNQRAEMSCNYLGRYSHPTFNSIIYPSIVLQAIPVAWSVHIHVLPIILINFFWFISTCAGLDGNDLLSTWARATVRAEQNLRRLGHCSVYNILILPVSVILHIFDIQHHTSKLWFVIIITLTRAIVSISLYGLCRSLNPHSFVLLLHCQIGSNPTSGSLINISNYKMY